MLAELAHQAGRVFSDSISRDEQRQLGQFMTPPPIARFMAQRLIEGIEGESTTILEPAAGSGILVAAVLDALLVSPSCPGHIVLLLYEIDGRLAAHLNGLCAYMAQACAERGVELKWSVTTGDFLLSDLALNGHQVNGLMVIANPPFFKIAATDSRAMAHSYAVWGQPNIYSLFMAACARITPPGGKFYFITPRSWMGGTYFQSARQSVLRCLTIEALHAFESRTDSFESDGVLQETMIMWAVGRATGDCGAPIVLTRSRGADDIGGSHVRTFANERIISRDGNAVMSIPTGDAEPLRRWEGSLASLGLKVSTGPVVAFRAREWLSPLPKIGSVPLLWMQHVTSDGVRWPKSKKAEHIVASGESAWMLLPNQPMVLMRRFSPKEAPRRVVCSSYEHTLPGEVIGLENHLNYIYRPGGRMSILETRGLSAYLSSCAVDEHLRGLAGTTQVNAMELRRLPIPPLDHLIAIGESVSAGASLVEIDAAVEKVLQLDGAEARWS